MVEPLVSELGFMGGSEVGREILNGACEPPPSADKYARAFIKALESPPHLRNRPQPVTPTAIFSNR